MLQVGHRSRSSMLARHWAVGAIVGAVLGTAAYLLMQGWDAALGPQALIPPDRPAEPAARSEAAGFARAAEVAPAIPAPGPEVVAVLDVDALLEVRREEREGVLFEEAGEPWVPSLGAPAGLLSPLPVAADSPEVPPMIPLSRY